MLHILTDAADFQMCILTSKILLNIFTSSILIILDKDADENVVKYLQYISMGFLIDISPDPEKRLLVSE